MNRFVFALVLILSAAPTKAEAPRTGFGDEFGFPACVPTEIDRLAALLSDDVLRDMVCRLSSARFTPARLGAALGVPEGQVLRRLHTLRNWGLVQMVRRDSATTVVEPLPGNGTRTLDRWASRYCAQGDACGRPTVNPERLQKEKHANLSRGVGVGGYASHSALGAGLKDQSITVFGGSGFIGRDLIKRLSETSAKVRLAVRNPERAVFVRSLEGAEQVSVVTVDVGDPADIAKAVEGATTVVNLIGILSEKGDRRFAELHEHTSRRIAEAAAGKAERLVQFSTVSANPKAESVYSRTKAAAEAAAIEKFPNVTVVRPSLVFDPEGGFVRRVTELSRFSKMIPLLDEGRTLFQPVYVGDVSSAIIRILEDPATKGKTYELGGPRKMSLRDLASLVMDKAPPPPPLSPMSSWLADVELDMYKWMPKPPALQENLSLLRETSVVHPNALGLADLGLAPTPLEDVLAAYRDRGSPGHRPKTKF